MSYEPLVVLGMHRSGTSLATSLLADAGLDVGERLLGAHPSNPRGHFEDEDFLDLHRGVLRQLGADEDGWVAAPLPAAPRECTRAARLLVDRKRASGRIWGWKDPRTVPLLPLWRAAVPDAWFVVVYRNPWEVVDSLFRRGDAAFARDPELGVRVWQHYNAQLVALHQSAPERCVVANTDAIAADPGAWVREVAHRTSMPLRHPAAGVVDPSLRHGTRARVFAELLQRWYPATLETLEALEQVAWRGRAGRGHRSASRAASEAADGPDALAGWRDAVAPHERDAREPSRPLLGGQWVVSSNAVGNQATLMRTPDGRMFRVAVEGAETRDLWDVQLRHRGVPFEAGATYELSFLARAAAERRIAFGVNTSDYRDIGLYREVTIGEAWRELRESFQPGESDAAGELHFDLGASPVPVELSDVVLTRQPD